MRENACKKARISLLVLMAVLLIIAGFLFMRPTVFATHAAGTDLLTQESGTPSQMTQFSELSEEECIELIVENGIEIPQDFVGSLELGGFVKWVIETVEANPNYEFMYSYDVLHNFVENIRDLVITNNTSQSTTQGQSIMAAAAYALQDNTQYGSWNNNFPNYNCYIYSIGRNDVFKNPGYFSNKSFSISMSIYEMAKLVEADLVALGKGGVYVSNIRPNILSPNETLIAIRKTTNTGLFAVNDYHFMKFHCDGGFWTHKPGQTAILKYNHQPADKNWKQEAIVNSSGTAQEGNLTYNSEIYYIIYNWSGLAIQGTTVTDFTPQAGFAGSITIPDGVTAIGFSAFANQTQLSQISIPASVILIDTMAFENTGLTSVTIHVNKELWIGSRAFGNIPSLSTVYFVGDSELRMDPYYFHSSYYYNSYMMFYGSDPNVYVPYGKADNYASVLNRSKVFDSAFTYRALGDDNYEITGFAHGYNITGNLIIPSRTGRGYVTQIADSAFENCNDITSATIPYSVESIGLNAFRNTGIWNNTPDGKVVYADNWAVGFRGSLAGNLDLRPDTVGISANAFNGYNGAAITSAVLPSGMRFIGKDAFILCVSLKSVTIPSSVTAIGICAFFACSSLKSITIPSSVTTIGRTAFGPYMVIYTEMTNRPSGWDYYWNNNRPVYWGINSTNFTQKDDAQYVIQNDNAVLTKYTGTASTFIIPAQIIINNISYNVTKIGNSAFEYNNSLTNIVILSGVTYIESWAFQRCTNLTKVFYGGTAVEWNAINISSNDVSLANAHRYYHSVDLPDISDCYWRYVDGVPTVWIVHTVIVEPNGGAGVDNIAIVEHGSKISNPGIPTKEGYTFNGWYKDVACLYAWNFAADTVTSYTTLYAKWTAIKYSITYNFNDDSFGISPSPTFTIEDLPYTLPEPTRAGYIFDGWFKNAAFTGTAVTQITTIDNKEFWAKWTWATATPGLLYTYIPYLDSYSVSNGTASASVIYIPAYYNGKPVTAIADYGFSFCYNITEVIFHEGSELLNIGDYAFADCSGLTSIVIPDSVINIGKGAFVCCHSLTSITIPDSVTHIGYGAFESTGLWRDAPGDSLVYVGDWLIGVKGVLADGLDIEISSGSDGVVRIADGALDMIVNIDDFAEIVFTVTFDADGEMEVNFWGTKALYIEVYINGVYQDTYYESVQITYETQAVYEFVVSGWLGSGYGDLWFWFTFI